MDYKNNIKGNIVPQPNSNDTQSFFTESNAGHISVQTTSPFRMRGSEFGTEQNLKSKNDRSSSIFGKKMPKDACSSATSKLLIKQIIREHNLDGDVFLKEGHVETNIHGQHRIEKKSNYSPSFLIHHVEFKRSAPTFNSKHSSMQLGLCSREESIVPVSKEAQCKHSERRIYKSNSEYSTKSSDHKQYAEKTTYCRPVISINSEFMNRAREKNTRLQTLVKKLAVARKREKEIEALNNHINQLKTNHDINHCDDELHYSPKNYECRRCNIIDNIYTSTLNRSNPCNDLLEEFYGACDEEEVTTNIYNCGPPRHRQQAHYDGISECYPMSSQGRLMMLKKERRRNPFSQDWQYRAPNRQFHGNTIVVDRENYRSKASKTNDPNTPRTNYPIENYKVERGTYSIDDSHGQKYKDLGTQTSIEKVTPNEETFLKRGETFIKDTLQEQYSRVSENVDRLKKKIQETVQRDGTSVLKSIENKLDTLIQSLNTFIHDTRSRTSVGQCYNCHSVNFNRRQFHYHNMNSSRSDTFGLIKAERLMCGLVADKSTKPINYTALNEAIAKKHCGTNINKILIEEIDNSNKVKNDIENILNGNPLKPCAVQLSFDIPTKERSTEVTESLSKSLLRFQDRSVSVEDVSGDGLEQHGRMTIAVNTDPLGLLALLRVSTETVKQLLSYMPNFSYYSYLQMIQLPQTRQDTNFVCNICGAAFARPSQLTDHIQGHDLGRTRDCCVCRHILEMQNHRPVGLFRCQYCGQRFTRAYCCELHQESCAKRFGFQHDITPSLMLLR